jgi:hypothetical protein
MSKAFKIVPGRYHIPAIGFVNAHEEVSDDKLFEIYKLSRRVFPFIDLGEDAESFLKKQKLNASQVGRLVLNARDAEEAKLLASLSDTKKVQNVLETKLKNFED